MPALLDATLTHQGCVLRAAAREIRSHVPEPFWYIHVSYRAPEGQTCAFTWTRGHIYDHAVATALYETCVDEPLATITRASHTPCTASPAWR